MNTICIMCPMGCPLEIKEVEGKIVVSGNTCKRGVVYGEEEYTHPSRTITSLVKTSSGKIVSVKTSSTVPKERIFDVVDEIGKIVASDSVEIGDKIASDILGLGVDLLVTGKSV